MSNIERTIWVCVDFETCLRRTALRHAAYSIGRELRAVLGGNLCFGSLDVGGIVRIFPRGRAIASLFETYEFRAHLRARQWARCGLRESRCCGMASTAEIRRAEADRSDARRHGRIASTEARFARRFTLACRARTRHAGTRVVVPVLHRLRRLLCNDWGDSRGCILLSESARSSNRRREQDHRKGQHKLLFQFELLSSW
jgi:hypothetical protein